MWQCTTGRPTPYINHWIYSCPSHRLVVSLISGQGYFTFLYGHTKHNREEGRKENKQTQTWVSSKRKKGEVFDTFLAFCELSRACILTKLPQSHQECWLIFLCWLNRPESTVSSNCSLLPTVLFCRLVCSCLLLLTDSSSLWDLPSLVLFRSRGRSHAQALCIGFSSK